MKKRGNMDSDYLITSSTYANYIVKFI